MAAGGFMFLSARSFVCSSVTILVNTIERMNWFWCRLLQVVRESLKGSTLGSHGKGQGHTRPKIDLEAWRKQGVTQPLGRVAVLVSSSEISVLILCCRVDSFQSSTKTASVASRRTAVTEWVAVVIFYRAVLYAAWAVLLQDIHLSVHLSVTRRCCVETAKHIIKVFFTVR